MSEIEFNRVIHGDCIEEMKKLPENSVDAIVTDPPYGIGFMGKEWDNFKPKEIKKTTKLIYKTDYIDGVPVKRKNPELVTRDSGARVSGTYDLSLSGNAKFQEWFKQVATECLRVLKPGGFLLSFGGTRTYHRLTCGIEDAGFEIRDTIMWLYGSGFPKSLNIGKSIDKIKGAKREVIGKSREGFLEKNDVFELDKEGYGNYDLTAPATPEAKQWEGWGTALKPACEPIVVTRKPLSEKNVALNVLKWGTGGINIDECRIEYQSDTDRSGWHKSGADGSKGFQGEDTFKIRPISAEEIQERTSQGRFPANIILDEEAGKMLDEQSGESVTKPHGGDGQKLDTRDMGWGFKRLPSTIEDQGGASRFFYTAKSSSGERNYGCEELEEKKKWLKGGGGTGISARESIISKNIHPTVKPVKLMEYLIKLVAPKGAVILDPFLGSGTTAIACLNLDRKFIGMEKEEEYVKIAEKRIKFWEKPKARRDVAIEVHKIIERAKQNKQQKSLW